MTKQDIFEALLGGEIQYPEHEIFLPIFCRALLEAMYQSLSDQDREIIDFSNKYWRQKLAKREREEVEAGRRIVSENVPKSAAAGLDPVRRTAKQVLLQALVSPGMRADPGQISRYLTAAFDLGMTPEQADLVLRQTLPGFAHSASPTYPRP